MFKLYGFPTQNNKKVLYTLEELGVNYEFQLVDLMKGENKTPEFLSMNPMGKLPVLQHDNNYLFESGAICRYLANVTESELYPSDKMERAKVDQWMDFFSNHLGRWLSEIYFEKVLKVHANLGTTNEKACERALKFVHGQAPAVDKWLGEHTYFLGEDLTIADLFAYAYLEQTKDCGIDMSDYPHIQKWMKGIAERDSVKRALKHF